MIKEFVKKWDKYNKDLEEYFRENKQSEYDTYTKIVKVLIEKVINKDEEFEIDTYNIEEMLVIDNGDYQGTQIFILHKNTYQPSIDEYIYTNVYYGSCSGCDTLLYISEYDSGLPNEEQINGYMNLALHLLQRFKKCEK